MAGEERVLEKIAAGAPLADVLHTLAAAIEERSKGSLCSILLLDEGGEQWRCVAAPSLPESCRQVMEGTAAGAKGSRGAVAHLRRPVTATDITKDPLWEGHRELALQQGLRAYWSVPILSQDDQVLGAAALYYRSPRGPSAGDRRLMERTVQIARIAIERARAEEALREGEARFRAIFENAAVGISLRDLKGRAVSVNPALQQLLGYSAEELHGMTFGVTTHPEDAAAESALFQELITGQRDAYQLERRGVSKDGRLFWDRVNRSLIRGGHGEPRFFSA